MILNKFSFHLKSFIKVAQCSNLWVSFKTEILSVFIINKDKKNEFIQSNKLRYLKMQYSSLLNTYDDRETDKGNYKAYGSNIIWIMWWQGENSMPPIVRACYNSVLKYKDISTKVVIITQNNYSDYVDIPNFILDKVNRHVISITHLSDIIRMSLLARHGGLWLDSTIYVTNKIPAKLVTGEFFSLSSPTESWYVSKCKWTGFAIGGFNPVFSFSKELFTNHWNKFNSFIDYYFIDYVMRLYFDNNEDFRKIVKKNTINTPLLYFLQENLSSVYNEEDMQKICRNNIFSKLTWKGNLIERDENGNKTFYGHIVNDL